jgi:predicted hydrocarbon binding protein
MTPAPTYFYPGRMGQIVLLAMEEILGRSGLNAVLNLAGLTEYLPDSSSHTRDVKFPFDHIGRLQIGLERSYGPRAGRGLAQRAGRACFKYGINEFGPQLGLTGTAFRLLPLPAKMKLGSEALASLFNNHSDQRVRLERDDEHIYWHIERCPLCWGRAAGSPDGKAPAGSDGPCCHLAVGLLQEGLYWLSAGRSFEVVEEKCIACGDSACTIVVDRTPMG